MPAPNTSSKTRRSYYTSDRVAALRQNAESGGVVADKKANAVEAATEVLDWTLNDLWTRVPGQAIPRSFDPGDGSKRSTWEPVADEQWAITNGEVTLPTNDFEAYRESGRDDRGFFDRDLADDTLLINERYPEKPPDWGVDDGLGWTDEHGDISDPGTTWVAVAYYAHNFVWRDIRDQLVSLRDAFLYTGQARFARAGTVLLDRIADVYPDLDISAYPHETFPNSHGFTGQGKALGSIWETGLIRDVVSAYDAVFPSQEDEDLVAFLDGKTEAYTDLADKGSVEGIRKNIESGIVREVLPAVKRAEIRGNMGMHQSALAMAAVVMDDPEGYTRDALEFLFQPGGLVNEDGPRDLDDFESREDDDWRVTGGDLTRALVDDFDRDGYGDEVAPNYNTILQRQLQRIADILNVYDTDVGGMADLYDHPTVARSARTHYDLVFLDRYVPGLGDSSRTGNPGRQIDPDLLTRYFEIYDDPVLARAAAFVNDRTTEGLSGNRFSDDVSEVADRIDAIVERHGPYTPDTTMLPGFGFTALRQGERTPEPDTRRAAWVYYGRNSSETGKGHTHRDTLNLGMYGYGIDLAPDLGYPEYTGAWPKKLYWTTNTVSHNTVVVDGEPHHPQRVSVPHHFEGGGRVALFDASAPRVYPGTETYRRTTVLVRIDDRDSYVFDVFRVTGGDDHVFSFHAAEGTVTTTGLELDPQGDGTYAGEAVRFPDRDEETAYDVNVGNGYNYLRDVRRDRDPQRPFQVDWSIEDSWGVHETGRDIHLQLTMVGDVDDVAIAAGEPPRKEGNPDSLAYLLAHRGGEDLDTAFTSVIEPYEVDSRIASIDSVPVTTGGDSLTDSEIRAVKVELDTGRTDYLASGADDGPTYTVDGRFRFSGAFALYSEIGGAPTYAHLTDGTLLHPCEVETPLLARDTPEYLSGRVEGFTRGMETDNEIVVDPDHVDRTTDLIGEHLYVHVPDDQNGVYEIQGVERTDDGCIAFDIGDATLVRWLENSSDTAAGYVYNIEPGARVRTPSTESWTADS